MKRVLVLFFIVSAFIYSEDNTDYQSQIDDLQKQIDQLKVKMDNSDKKEDSKDKDYDFTDEWDKNMEKASAYFDENYPKVKKKIIENKEDFQRNTLPKIQEHINNVIEEAEKE